MEKKYKKALRLEYFTAFYNILEALISIIAGRISNSIALIGFGLDSIVESLSGFILIWRLRKHGRITEEEEEQLERQASRYVGVSFWFLALYIGFEAVRKIIIKDVPQASIPGIVIAALSLIVMPLLANSKLKLGQKLQLKSLIADSKETLVCAWLSAALLLGLVLNALFGFWIADPIVGLLICLFLIREGWELIFEDECED